MVRVRHSAAALALSLAATACSGTGHGPAATAADSTARVNPFFHASSLPYQAPPFDQIREGDYQPAIEEGMAQHLAEVGRIARDTATPTFDNTYVALERSGVMLDRVLGVFNAITSANTDPVLQKVQTAEAPELAAHQDAIYLNDTLYRRLDAVYRRRASLTLDPESQRLIEVVHRNFVRAGAELSPADKVTLRAFNQEESTLSTAFGNRLLAAAKDGALLVGDSGQLAGLSTAELADAKQAAHDRGVADKFVVILQNTTQQPALQDLVNRTTRNALFDASWTRAEKGDSDDTRAIVARLAQLRAQRAHLLGYPSYAAWKLDDQMARTPANVLAFVGKLAPAAVARARSEAADIQARIDSDQAASHQPTFALEPWDWNRYAEEVRKARYSFDESQIRPYFELDSVLKNGVFYAATKLYGITFKPRPDIPVYQPDVRVFEVLDSTGKSLALFYTDYFTRDNKSGGAWMDNFVGQSRLRGTRPVIFNVANFAKPAAGQPALLSFDDVTTMFHEFGHALHGMFADAQYPTLSGTNTARDFVEFPSQFNEHWASDSAIFAHYARHYQTGAPMPPDLVAKMRQSSKFNAGYGMTETVEAALLDMDWHMLDAKARLQNVDSFEVASLKRHQVDLIAVPPRYRSSYFLHIWGNGYAAGYYAYLWTQMLADDAFADFTAHGGLTRANGDRFRAMILSRGNTEDLARLYREWRGQDPGIEPMLVNRGLKPGSN